MLIDFNIIDIYWVDILAGLALQRFEIESPSSSISSCMGLISNGTQHGILELSLS